MDGVLIDVWTSLHCLKQDLGHQAGLNKSCSRRLGRKNSNRHMPLWLRLYKKKSFQTVLDDLEPCMGVVDGLDMILKYVWRCLLCLNKILANRPDLLYSQQVEVPFPASNGFQNFMQQCYICPRWYGWPSNWCSDVITLGTYKYKYTNTNTNTQIHKYTNTQIHKYTNTNSHIQIQIH